MVPNPVEEDISELIQNDLNISQSGNKSSTVDLFDISSPIPQFSKCGKGNVPYLPSLLVSPRRTLFDSYWEKERSIEVKREKCIDDKQNDTGERCISPLNLSEPSSSLEVSKTRPQSILRCSSERTRTIEKPSNLRRSKSASLRSMKNAENSNRGCLGLPPSLLHFMHQHREIKFDPLVSVLEYQEEEDESQQSSSKHQSCRWFTDEELEKFRAEAIFQTRKCPFNRELDMQRLKAKGSNLTRPSRALFTHQALRATPEETLISDGSYEWYSLLQEEIQNILIVDSDEQSKYRLKRAMQQMIPHAFVQTANNSEIAFEKVLKLRKSSPYGFDIIIVEERLGSHHLEPIRLLFDQSSEEANKCFDENSSGSKLLQKITKMDGQLSEVEVEMPSPTSTICLTPTIKIPLLIGVSSYLGEDGEKLSKSGADLLWGCIPSMDHVLRNEILNMILAKRDRNMIVCG